MVGWRGYCQAGSAWVQSAGHQRPLQLPVPLWRLLLQPLPRAANEESIGASFFQALLENIPRRPAKCFEIFGRGGVCCHDFKSAARFHFGQCLLGFEDGDRAGQPAGINGEVGDHSNLVPGLNP